MGDSSDSETDKPVNDTVDEHSTLAMPGGTTEVNSDNSGGPASPKSTHSRKRLWLFVVIIVVVVLAAGGTAFGLYVHHKNVIAANKAKAAAAASTTTTQSHTTTPVKPITANTFFETPKLLSSDLHFFKDPETYFGNTCTGNNTGCKPAITSADIVYYQIGTTAAKQAIVVAYDTVRTVDSFQYVAIETTTGHYSILAQLDDGLQNQVKNYPDALADFKNALSPSVTLDVSTTISDLTFPASATAGGLSVKLPSPDQPSGYLMAKGLDSIRMPYYGTPALSTTKLADVSGHRFYQATVTNSDNYKVEEIYGTTNAVYAAAYSVDESLNSKDLKADWLSGDNNTSTYASTSQGCGSANGYLVAKNIDKSALMSVGTANGATLYQLPLSAPLFTEIYNGYHSTANDLGNESLAHFTQQGFQDAHGVFLSQNQLGEWVIHERSDLFIGGGCGKPVVYLYPQTPTNVSIQVGADVRKSVPLYVPGKGWQNVLALPGGQLFYNGASYDSLFWEGFGNGVYPDIASGTVVPRSQVASTIRLQLATQGLNAKEANDFMAFWQPKLPKTAYTRLTWLSLPQINQLAPLTISPKPNTVIRVFLDFQGLDQPQTLPAQQLSAPQRQGFTVVEWGGLLRDGSLQR